MKRPSPSSLPSPCGLPARSPARAVASALAIAALVASLGVAAPATAQDIRIAHISDQTGPLEAYAKQTQIGLMIRMPS